MLKINTILFLLLASAVSAAASDTPIVEVTETMMSVAEMESATLGLAAGPDAFSQLQFASFVDPVARTFTFSTLPGQTYLGMSVMLTSTGTYAGNGQYSFAATGSIGGSPWTETGTGLWSGDPTETISQNVDIFRRTYAVRGAVETMTDENGVTTSQGDFVYYDINDKFQGGTTGKDVLKNGTWQFTFDFEPSDICGDRVFGQSGSCSPFETVASGMQGLDGVGSFTFQNLPVPEPGTIIIASTGLAIILRRKGVKRR